VTDVVGIVLAAGSSSRLGRPKQTLAFGAGTLLAHVVADVEASALDRVVVVLGGDAPNDVAAIRPGRAEVTRADAEGDGSGGCALSLRAGLDAAGECAAIVLLLGDMPGVTPRMIDSFVAAWRASPTWAAVAAYADGIGHPFLFSADAFAALLSLHGDKAVWKIVDQEREARVARIAIDAPLPRDVDTWDDYAAVCRTFGFEPEAALG
jgi:molybdenum cofactor cytidylyltransferase